MNITVIDQEQCKKQLRLEIEGDKVRAETDRVAAGLARQVNVAGFRRGHVPKSVVKTRFRKELRDEVVAHLLPHAFSDAVREKNLKVLGEPSIQDLKFGDDESIDVTFTVEVAPEFELSNYKELPVTKRIYKISDEDVEKNIAQMREENAEMVPVEDRGAQPGDTVTANLTVRSEPVIKQPAATAETEAAQQEASETAVVASTQKAYVEEDEPKETTHQDVEIELGAEGAAKEFTEALTGARPGDVRTFTAEHSADDSEDEDEEGEAQPEAQEDQPEVKHRLTYTAEVTAVRVKELPEANDEFARSVSEFQTIDELRASIRSKLERQAEHKAAEELRSAIVEKLVDRNRFEIPEVVVEKQIDARLSPLLRQFTSQGIDPRSLKIDWRGLRESIRERAERDVRGSFILDKIADTEKIEVSDEELDQEIEQIATSMGQTTDALKARLTKAEALDTIREQVRDRKALDFVIASASVQTEEVEGSSGEAAAGDEGGQAEG